MRYHVVIFIFCSLLIVGGIRVTETSPPPLTQSCNEPLGLKIGSIDERFNLSDATLKQIINEAAQLWSNAVGRTIAIHSDSGTVMVNLIYSNAQAFTDNENTLLQDINKKKLHYQSLEQSYRQLFFNYNKQLESYDNTNIQLQEAQQKYQKVASRWNTGVVVSKQEDNKLDKLKDKIFYLYKESEDKLVKLNRLIRKMQEQSAVINDLANRINELVYQHQEKFHAEKIFHQGAYIKAAEKRRINIYQYDNLDKLKLVLAHEIGHALGLSHLQNPRSVMYYLMEAQNSHELQLSKEDVKAIKKVCEFNTSK